MRSVLFLYCPKYVNHSRPERNTVMTGFDSSRDVVAVGHSQAINNSAEGSKMM